MVRVQVIGAGPHTVQTVTVVVKPSGHPVAEVDVVTAPSSDVKVVTVCQSTTVKPVLQISV